MQITLSILLALLLLATGGGKLAGSASSLQIRDSLRIGAASWRMIGAFEAVTVALLVAGIWARPATIAAAGAVVILMVGALAARVRAGGDQRRVGIPVDIIVLVLGLVLASVSLSQHR